MIRRTRPDCQEHPNNSQSDCETCIIAKKKITTEVKINDEVTITNDDKRVKYALKSLVCHSGVGTVNGHYVSYSKAPNSEPDEKMYILSNDQDQSTKREELPPSAKKNVYMLFYKKVIEVERRRLLSIVANNIKECSFLLYIVVALVLLALVCYALWTYMYPCLSTMKRRDSDWSSEFQRGSTFSQLRRTSEWSVSNMV